MTYRNGKDVSFTDLVDIMMTLRGEEGCPWDKEQTHESIKKYLVEETYEVLDAIDEKDMYKLCEELGDLLLQITFHARMAEENGHFNINDVIKGIVDKMIRRHPHVFGSEDLETSEQVLVKWEEIKDEERDQPRPVLDVPKNFPALYRAEKLQQKAARVGFDWPDIQGAWDKVSEELGELREAEGTGVGIKEELGDLLFAVVNAARFLGVDAEEALQDANRKFIQRFSYIESQAKAQKVPLQELSLEEMDQYWNQAKKINK
ncbi:nucleoside triphosphate pyrophosphohydrolase [Dehalobacterium formicoaceticum]|uniref:Nucleoside triphosphate pyrophosphohydrolase n=1 Tax=Dehalobacterium formicoaceticum TaxID=51515 RepID=A0ABT1Y397_9FIRM|nr:nucleoside triphosphate pyrophosphohydrolase [Dehalobacterium formicoaceticum]MCR6545339.1 nucleoside triphosphate pyrophosphohydrolase [Dehalobacterium formicoaceticum]